MSAIQLISDVTAGKMAQLFGFPVSVTVLYFPVALDVNSLKRIEGGDYYDRETNFNPMII
jgi:hypothetical protein